MSYFKSEKMMLLKCRTQYVSKFGKLSSVHRTGKCQSSFQSQRRAMPKNVQTTTQLHLFHMPARKCSKSFFLGFNSTWSENFQMFKQRNYKSNCQHLMAHIKSKGIPEKKIYLCFTEYAKAFDCVGHNTLWKILKETETRYLPPEKPVCRSRGNS